MKRVHQSDWETPKCNDWVATLQTRIMEQPATDTILVAHSLACCLVGKWAEQHGKGPIKGALLVGPSDTEAPSYPPGTSGFVPMPLSKLPFRSIVAASSNDDYVTLDRARFFARKWGSELFNVGPLGHINSASNLGLWSDGMNLLMRLRTLPKRFNFD